MFSFSRLHGADPMLGVEMASTGEVGCFGDDLHEALLHAHARHRVPLPERGACCCRWARWQDKYWFADEARVIADELQLPDLRDATARPRCCASIGIACTPVGKGDGDDGQREPPDRRGARSIS